MRLRGKLTESLEPEDILALVENRVGESKTLDFKLTLPGNTNQDKKDFLADCTAMANTSGGVLLYGMQTRRDENGRDTGIAEKVVGLGRLNEDVTALRLQNILTDGVSPALASQVRFKWLDVPGANGQVLVLGMGRSLLSPHRVVFDKVNKFYRRSEAGNYEPDVSELRQMFVEAREWMSEANLWRENRIVDIHNQRIYASVTLRRATFIHVLPLGRLTQALDMRGLGEILRGRLIPPGNVYTSWRYNADGFLIFALSGEKRLTQYAQALRFGGVEGYSNEYVWEVPQGSGKMVLAADILEREVGQFVTSAIHVVREILGQDPPYIIMVSVHGVARATIPASEGMQKFGSFEIEQDNIIPPPIVIDDPAIDIAAAVQPITDVIWQSGGYQGRIRT